MSRRGGGFFVLVNIVLCKVCFILARDFCDDASRHAPSMERWSTSVFRGAFAEKPPYDPQTAKVAETSMFQRLWGFSLPPWSDGVIVKIPLSKIARTSPVRGRGASPTKKNRGAHPRTRALCLSPKKTKVVNARDRGRRGLSRNSSAPTPAFGGWVHFVLVKIPLSKVGLVPRASSPASILKGKAMKKR